LKNLNEFEEEEEEEEEEERDEEFLYLYNIGFERRVFKDFPVRLIKVV
jgi:hypothetical protein